jgi:hypothetical protein
MKIRPGAAEFSMRTDRRRKGMTKLISSFSQLYERA